MKPQFFIIAGPNGAGKSTYVRDFVPGGTFIFNGDLVYADLLKRYPGYDPGLLGGGVAAQLDKDRDESIAAKKDFCFESNYSNDLATEITQTFKAAGYEVNLIYFGLNNLEAATSRVQTRVAMGGHNITDLDIKHNFEDGIIRLIGDLSLFDRIQFIDTSVKQSATIIAYSSKNDKSYHLIHEDVPWFKKNFKLKMSALQLDEPKQVTSKEIIKEFKKQKNRPRIS